MTQRPNNDFCPITGEPLHLPGQTVSQTALDRVAEVAKKIPTLMPALEVDAVQSAHLSVDGVRPPMGPRAPVNVSVLSEILALSAVLRRWMWQLRGRFAAGQTGTSWKDIAEVLTLLAPRASQWEHAPQMVREVTRAIRTAEKMLSGPEDTRARGLCPTCRQIIYGPEGSPTLRCNSCGTVTTGADASMSAWAEIPDLWLTPTHAAAAAGLLVGQDIPAGTVRSWIARGKITPVAGTVKVADVVGKVAVQR